MMRFVLSILLFVVMLGCEPEPPLPAIVVYAPGGEESVLEQTLKEFSSATNVPVVAVWGDSTKHTDQLISNANDVTDILITDNVADLMRATEEGKLRPISAAAFIDADPLLKDADRFWVAIDVRFHAIASAKRADGPLVESYDALASPDLQGRLCLSSSKLHVNRSLMAMLVNERGVKQTERLVRSWVQNLAVSPFASDEELIEAIRDGTCDYGITAWMPEHDDVAFFLPEGAYLDIDGIGVTRHARQPDSAQKLVEWLIKNRTPHVESKFARQSVDIAGWNDEEATLLAERAVYR